MDSNSSNFSTVHFKSSNGTSNSTGRNGQPFLGDCIRFDTGPNSTLDFRVVQFDSAGTIFHFYLRAGAFSGTSFVEIIGGSYGFVPNHTFTWLCNYHVTMPEATNYITATRRLLRSTIYTPGVNSDTIDIRTVGSQSIKIAPPNDHNESSLSFYRYNNEGLTQAGDYWTMGHGAYGAGAGNFGLGTWSTGGCLMIDKGGKVSCPYGINNRVLSFQDGSVSTNYRLGTLTLPQGGHQAKIKVSLCGGYNVSTTSSMSTGYRISNYVLDINLYSGNGGVVNGVVTGSCRGFDPYTTGGSPYSPIGIFYSGYCICTSPHTTPLSVYLGFVPGDPLNKVEVWILSYAWHGVPLIEVTQTAGIFDQSTNVKMANMPLT